nr:stage III sporulation protein AF [uncultured Anaerobutyricum sp.]
MEYIKGWLKTILYMNILLLICDNLMKKTSCEKYYRFFSGFLLVLCLLKPVIDFTGTEPYFHASFIQKEWKNEWNVLKNSKELRGIEDQVRKERETAYQNQIKEIADSCGVLADNVVFRWDETGENIKKIKIRGNFQEGETKKQIKSTQIETLKKIIMRIYNLEEADIRIEVG